MVQEGTKSMKISYNRIFKLPNKLIQTKEKIYKSLLLAFTKNKGKIKN
jgi:hypothetical protein